MGRQRDNISTKPLTYAAIGAVLLAVLNLLWVTSTFGEVLKSNANSIAQGGTGWSLNWSEVWRHIFIEGTLVVAAIGLLYRRLTGLVVSLIAFLLVGVEYVWWYFSTQALIRNAGLTRLPAGFPQAGNLAGGTTWNLIVLGLALAFLVFEALILFNHQLSRRAGNNR